MPTVDDLAAEAADLEAEESDQKARVLASLRDRKRKRALSDAEATIRIQERQINVLEQHLAVREDLADMVFVEPPPINLDPDAPAQVIPILLQSDEHYDSTFDLASTGGINEQNPDMAEEKVETLIRRTRRLVEREAIDNHVPGIITPLMGDMIEGELHAKSERSSPMTPMEAARFAYRLKRRIFDEMLKWDIEWIRVPCVTGNHGRTTAKRTPGLNQRYSYEHDVYLRLAEHYETIGEDRIRFYTPPTDFVGIAAAPGFRMVITHGDSVRGGGGIGGLAPPILRAASRWAKATPADLYCLGHFHQLWDLGSLIVNPSAVGYDPYAAALGLDPGPHPHGAQFFTTYHTGRKSRATTAPIWVR